MLNFNVPEPSSAEGSTTICPETELLSVRTISDSNIPRFVTSGSETLEGDGVGAGDGVVDGGVEGGVDGGVEEGGVEGGVDGGVDVGGVVAGGVVAGVVVVGAGAGVAAVGAGAEAEAVGEALPPQPINKLKATRQNTIRALRFMEILQSCPSRLVLY